MTLPRSYLDASIRCITPLDAARDRFGVAFDLADGSTVRVALTLSDGSWIAAEQGQRRSTTNSHWASSSGKPTSDGSTPSDGENVCPPTRSSNAEAGE